MLLAEKIDRYQAILKHNRELYTAAQECLRSKPEISERDRLFLLVFAPVLLEYTKWVLRQSLADDRKRVYFLARDSWLMYAAAEKICAEWNIPIECRYLRVSRYAIRQAQYKLIGDKSLDLLCTNGIDTTIEKVMKRAGLSPCEAQQVIDDTGHRDDSRRVLTYPQLQELKRELKEYSGFLQLLEAHSTEAYPKVLGYLRQEGLFDDVAYALADSGWIGTLQQSVDQLIRNEEEHIQPLQGYYFGLYEIPKGMDNRQYKTFYFSPGTQFRRKVHFANSLFEAIFSSPEGMTTGYRQTKQGFEPVASERKNPNASFLNRCRELSDTFVSTYLQLSRNQLDSDTKVCANLLGTFMSNPSKEEVELYGNLLFCDDLLEMQMQKVAAELSEEEIKNQSIVRKALILAGIRNEEIHESAWIEGSIVRNDSHTSRYLRQAARYKSLVYLKKSMKRV